MHSLQFLESVLYLIGHFLCWFLCSPVARYGDDRIDGRPIASWPCFMLHAWLCSALHSSYLARPSLQATRSGH